MLRAVPLHQGYNVITYIIMRNVFNASETVAVQSFFSYLTTSLFSEMCLSQSYIPGTIVISGGGGGSGGGFIVACGPTRIRFQKEIGQLIIGNEAPRKSRFPFDVFMASTRRTFSQF